MAPRPDAGDAWTGFGTAWTIIAELLAAMAVWGVIGYVVDRLVGTTRVFVGLGVLIGGVTGLYLVYLRYGRDNDQT